MGLGGDVTVLNCHIEHADTHMTLNPVAVNYQCWAARRATAHIERRRRRRVRPGGVMQHTCLCWDEIVQNWRKAGASRAIGSAVRAAGCFPTQGGGLG